jgi:protease IV
MGIDMLEKNNPEQWERQILERLAMEAMTEQRRKRRWGIFFKLLGFAYLAVFLVILSDIGGVSSEKITDNVGHTALITVDGVLASGSETSAEQIIPALQAAFAEQSAKGLIVRINSPGGSPVQAGLINDEIRRLRQTRPNWPVYAVVEEICASGGYYIAVAAEHIYVDKASIVGSIGVLMNGFGFVGSMEKLGIERRLITAGENKGFLDPFSPADPGQYAKAKVMLDDVHRQFIDVVRRGRGERLTPSDEVFSGLVWSGEQSIVMGLADGLGSVESVARDMIKAEEIRDYTQRRSLAERFAQRFGADVAAGIVQGIRAVNMY